jgi:hypothetical protein
MGAGSENSIRRIAAQGFCLLLGQYASPLFSVASGDPVSAWLLGERLDTCRVLPSA